MRRRGARRSTEDIELEIAKEVRRRMQELAPIVASKRLLMTAMREVLQDFLEMAKLEALDRSTPEPAPRVLVLVSSEGGAVRMRARVEDGRRASSTGMAKVIPMPRRSKSQGA